ncbi:hypothetical protein [Halalkalicoccus paucihalophilus]|nr:hypothetical protein [Halalkalicoccus paucihalophilus]
MKQAAPFGDLCGELNKSLYDVYEDGKWVYKSNRYQSSEKDCMNDLMIDLSKVKCYGYAWEDNLEDIQSHILYHIIQNASSNKSALNDFFSRYSGDLESIERNLTNGWRDEFALNDPIGKDEGERMKTVEWRITMCYYSIFKAQSALMHCRFNKIRENAKGGSHVQM